jgi:hypothetical protein
MSLKSRQFQEIIHFALRSWHEGGDNTTNGLYTLQLIQEQKTKSKNRLLATDWQAIQQVLLQGIEALAQHYAREAEILRSHFIDGRKARTVASHLKVSRDVVNRLQKSAIKRLAEILIAKETEARNRRVLSLEQCLESPQYDHLFGFEQAQNQLVKKLLSERQGWVTVVAGIGGIGKTALADASARAAIQSLAFERMAWVRVNTNQLGASPNNAFEGIISTLADTLAPHQPDGATPRERLVRVREILKSQPCLVVIDNLEDKTETEYILEQLKDLTRPSKFLITSRYRPSGESSIFALTLDELSLPDAAHLIRHHAETIGQTALVSAPDEVIDSIYRVVGGNPLALRLVVSLVGVEPLPQVLKAIQRKQTGPSEDLFTRIYWKAWQSLGRGAQSLLQAMPLVAEIGGSAQHLQAISRLSETQFWSAIRELVSRSLLEVRGNLNARRYSIHRLTETFVRAEVTKAPPLK